MKKPEKIKKSSCNNCSDCCSYCTETCDKFKRYEARKFINQVINEYDKFLPDVVEIYHYLLKGKISWYETAKVISKRIGTYKKSK